MKASSGIGPNELMTDWIKVADDFNYKNPDTRIIARWDFITRVQVLWNCLATQVWKQLSCWIFIVMEDPACIICVHVRLVQSKNKLCK